MHSPAKAGPPQAVFDIVEEAWGRPDLEEAQREATAGGELERRFREAFHEYLGGQNRVYSAPSGREALRLVLMQLPADRPFVLLPAFLCKAVGEAVLQAGRRLLLFDSGAAAGSVDWDQASRAMRRRPVAALVVPHLFGLPLNTCGMVEEARRHGVAVIEDCAHCLGGKVGGKMAGTFGDYAIFSFNYCKPLCLAGGGLLVVHADARFEAAEGWGHTTHEAEVEEFKMFCEYLHRVRSRLRGMRTGKNARLRRLLGGALGANMRYARWLYYAASGRKDEEDELRVASGLGPLRAALGLAQLRKYDAVMQQRRANYLYLAERLGRLAGEFLSVPAGVEPAWMSCKWMLPARWVSRLPRLEEELRRSGFGAGRIHWYRTLDQQPSLTFRFEAAGPLHHARRYAVSALELPIHQNLGPDDLDRMCAVIERHLGRA